MIDDWFIEASGDDITATHLELLIQLRGPLETTQPDVYAFRIGAMFEHSIKIDVIRKAFPSARAVGTHLVMLSAADVAMMRMSQR